MCCVPTCWERDRAMAGIATDAPGAAPPKEKVRLWEALSVACGVETWWLMPLMRSKSSADGGTAFEAGVEVVVVVPNRSVTVWDVPELDEAGGLAGKALQSPNSPFPLDEAAAKQRHTVLSYSLRILFQCHSTNTMWLLSVTYSTLKSFQYIMSKSSWRFSTRERKNKQPFTNTVHLAHQLRHSAVTTLKYTGISLIHAIILLDLIN